MRDRVMVNEAQGLLPKIASDPSENVVLDVDGILRIVCGGIVATILPDLWNQCYFNSGASLSSP